MSNPDQAKIPFSSSIDDYVGRRYTTSIQRWIDTREQQLLQELLIKHCGSRDKSVLDLPSGYGRFLPVLKDLDYRVCAMDISPVMVDYVRNRAEFERGDIAQVADIREGLPLANNSMAAVICIRLFQHLHYPAWRRQALSEFARVSEGPVIVTFYHKKCLHFWTKQLLALIKRKPVRVQMISREVFEADARAAGLEVVEYRAKMAGIHAQTFAVLRRSEKALDNPNS